MRVAARGGGGLVTALRNLASHHDVTWIASAMTDEDRVVAREARADGIVETARGGSEYRLRLVAHDPEAYELFYNVVANPTLWFLQHGLWDLLRQERRPATFARAWTDGYVAVNGAFAEAAVSELEREPDAAVLLHDYHLYLAPRFVRDAVAAARISHFVHIPWPERDAWEVLPREIATEIHASLLAGDTIGFHAERWQRNFLECVSSLLGVERDASTGAVEVGGRVVSVRRNPISVDPAEFEELAASEDVIAAERELVAGRPQKLVVRVDRTDPSKNVVRGFRAFELYLEAHPRSHGRVRLLALLDPSRQDIPEYADYLAAIELAAAAVNERFGHAQWQPIDLRVRDDFPQTIAAYKQFDVLFVNAVFDGLNLVAKEGPLVNEQAGAVVLSENTGAFAELRDWVLAVDPFDVAEQAAAIHTALELPAADRRERLDAIRAYVREHDLAAWLERELAALPVGDPAGQG